MVTVQLGQRWIGEDCSTYFIADISANHDGDLERAKDLICLAKEAGADSAKFQNFRAPKIVSRHGFESMGQQVSHQSQWRRSVYAVYQHASIPWEWTGELKAHCDRVNIDYASSPYDLEAVDMLEPYVAYFKIGSGDITWPEMIQKVGGKKKPIFIATGASRMEDVQRAMSILAEYDAAVVLMQCNTNYTASLENFRHVHLNVLKTYRSCFPQVVLGLSDHTPGHATALGAVALGARVLEKHFTDDTSREGPDHAFSMTSTSWREMVARTRELENALGSAQKNIAANECDTVIVQRRCLRAACPLTAGSVLTADMVEALRPAPPDGIFPYELSRIIGKRLTRNLAHGESLRWAYLTNAE